MPRTIVRTRMARPVVVRVPSNIRHRRTHHRRINFKARDEKHTMAAVTAAAVFGFATRSGVTLPHIAAIGQTGTYGLLAWVASNAGYGGKMLRHVATGLLCVAANELAAGTTVSGDEDLMGSVAED